MAETVKIKGMMCNHCLMAVKKALNEIPGITNVEVDLEKGEAAFDRESSVSSDQIRHQIEKAGYAVG